MCALNNSYDLEQDQELAQLVSQHTVPSTYTRKDHIQWTEIANRLQRSPIDCKSRWYSTRRKRVAAAPKMYRFTAAEDELIKQRVEDWGSRGVGIWESLAGELGQNADSVLHRWKLLMQGNQISFYWDEHSNALLREATDNGTNNKGWKHVQAVLNKAGFRVTADQCQKRWNNYEKYNSRGFKNDFLSWTPEEELAMVEMVLHQLRQQKRRMDELAEEEEPYSQRTLQETLWAANELFVSLQGTKASSSSEAGTILPPSKTRSVSIAWAPIGEKLRIVPTTCQAKWNSMRGVHLKPGKFTEEEDAIILKRIGGRSTLQLAESKGFWVDLGRELGRPHDSVNKRYKSRLFLKQM